VFVISVLVISVFNILQIELPDSLRIFWR